MAGQAQALRDLQAVSATILKHYEGRVFANQETSGDARSFLEDYWAITQRYGWDRATAAAFFFSVVKQDVWQAIKLHARTDAPTADQINASFVEVANPGGVAKWNRIYTTMMQDQEETVTAFYARFITAALNAHPTWDQRRLQADVLNFEQKLRLGIYRYYQLGANDLATAYQHALAAELQASEVAAREAAVAQPAATLSSAQATVASVQQDRVMEDLVARVVAALKPQSCYNCGRVGHFQMDCPDKVQSRGGGGGGGGHDRRSRGRGRSGGKSYGRRRSNAASSVCLESDSLYSERKVYKVLAFVENEEKVNIQKSTVLRLPTKLGNKTKECEAVIDSGAAVSVIDHDLLRKTLRLQPRKATDGKMLPRLETVDGTRLNVTGMAAVDVTVNGRRVKNVPLYAIKGLAKSHQLVLGVDFLDLADAMPYIRGGRLVFADEMEAAVRRKEIVASVGEGDVALEAVLDKVDFGDVAQRNLSAWREVCRKYPNVWARGPDDFGAARLPPLKFQVNDDTPFYAGRRQYTQEGLSAIHRQVDVWLNAGKVQQVWDATSSSPVVTAPKPGSDDLRICIDFSRTINPRIPLLSYVLPTMNEVLEAHAGSTVFSNVDFKDAFLQVPLHEDSIPWTAFFVPGRGTFVFKYMPFGLNVAPLYLQQCLDHIFAGLSGVSGYADDWIPSGTGEEQARSNLDKFLSRCADKNLKLKPEKCHLGHTKINVLGRQLSEQGVSLQEEELAVIDAWPVPKSFEDLAQFRGKVQWVGEYVPGSYDLMTALKKERIGKRFRFGKEQRRAFWGLKQALKKALVLKLPNPNRPFVLEVDASRTGFGAVLMQDGLPVHFASRKVSPTESGLHVSLLEMSAAVWAVEKYDYLLRGTHFTLVTDHKALSWLRSLKSPHKKLAVWASTLSQYSFDIEYRKGSEHVMADLLSRAFEVPIVDSEAGKLVVSPVEEVSDRMPTREEFIAAQQADDNCRGKLEALAKGDKSLLSRDFIVDADGILCKLKFWWDYPTLLPVVPKDDRFRARVLHAVHQRAAHSRKASTSLLKSNFFWNGCVEDMEKFASRCRACQERKSSLGPRQVPEGTAAASRVNDLVACDVMSGLMPTSTGHEAILVFQDFASGYKVAVPLRSKTSAEVAKAAEVAWLNPYPGTRTILTDRGGEFLGAEFKALLRRYGIKHMVSSDHHPHGNGRVENANRWIADGLAATLNDLKLQGADWPAALRNTMLGLNSAPNAATGQVPFYVFHSRPPPQLSPTRPVELTEGQKQQTRQLHNKTLEQVAHTQKQRIQQAQANNKILTKVLDFKLGDLVLVYRSAIRKGAYTKLNAPWVGPCKVVELRDEQHVKVELLKEGFTKLCSDFKGSVHVSRVKPWRGFNPSSTTTFNNKSKLEPTPIHYKPTPRDVKGAPLPPHAQLDKPEMIVKKKKAQQVKPSTMSFRPRPVTRSVSKTLLRGPA